MDLDTERLRSQLDPHALQVLKKRLVAGKITPRLFKDILRRQMVRYYFEAHPHPLTESWTSWRNPSQKLTALTTNTAQRSRATTAAGEHHKRF